MSLLFTNATSNRVAVASASGLNNLAAFTVIAWLYRTTTLASGTIYNKGSFTNQTRHPFIGMRGNDGATPSVSVDRATVDAVATGDNAADILPLNTWAFSATTFDATDGPRLFRGLLTSAAVECTYFAAPTVGSGAVADDTAETACIGNTSPADAQTKAFPGRIGLLAVYNRRFSLAELRAYQFNPRNDANCVLFQELGWNGTGAQADLSGHAANGTVTGATVAPHVPLPAPFSAAEWRPYAVGAAPATSGVASLRGSGRLASSLAKGASSTVAIDGGARLGIASTKASTITAAIDAGARFAIAAAKASVGLPSEWATARLGVASVTSRTTTAMLRSLAQMRASSVPTYLDVASLRAWARIAAVGSRGSAGSVSASAGARLASSGARAALTTAAVRSGARLAVAGVRAATATVGVRASVIGQAAVMTVRSAVVALWAKSRGTTSSAIVVTATRAHGSDAAVGSATASDAAVGAATASDSEG